MRRKPIVAVTLALAVVIATALWALHDRNAAPPRGYETSSSASPPAELVAESEAPATASALATATARESLAADPASPGITLHVTDLEERPIAGARVRTFEDSVAAETTTGDDGTCVLPVPPGEDSMLLWIDAAGFQHWRRPVPRRAEAYVSLYPTTTLFGRVLDAVTGAAIPDAWIRFEHVGCQGCAAEERRSDEDGRYEFAGLPIQHVRLLVGATEHAVQPFALLLEPGARTELDLRLERGTAVAGIVVDALDTTPVQGVSVVDGESWFEITRSGSNGAFRVLLQQADGRRGVSLHAPGYCSLRLDLPPEVPGGEPVHIPLPRAASCSGVVRDEAGPVAGAVVMVQDDGDAVDPSDRPVWLASLPPSWGAYVFAGGRVVTGTDGRFDAVAVVPWLPLFVTIEHPDHRRTQERVGAVGAAGQHVERSFTLVSLSPSGTVHGSVTINGTPVWAKVTWTGATRAGEAIADHGSFRARVEAGPVELRAVRLDSSPEQEIGKRALIARSGEDIACDFAATIQLAQVSGRVLRAEGGPCVGVRVSASGGPYYGITDARGAFTIDVPALGGPCDVAILTAGIWQIRRNVPPGTTGLEFVVPQSGHLRYRVIDRDTGQPLGDCSLSWRARDGECSGQDRVPSTPVNGGWRACEVPIGRYDLTAEHADSEAYRADLREDVEVRAGETTEVAFALRARTRVRFRLADGEAPLPSECAVLLLEPDAWVDAAGSLEKGSWRWKARTPAREEALAQRVLDFQRDRAELRGLPKGRYRFRVFGASLAIEPEFVDVGSGVNPEIELRWHATK